ncbi:hypothetical protein DPMN_037965 [Dreissena polymorpha]|uniref:Uncharacterized protein n=1 Tax=Dreissena polymorpha TaxID=45954 RepID=A0A9D4RQB1_DREPO|nr:hypothetical protein DPMN_037965 [Dreissena polymorpha]
MGGLRLEIALSLSLPLLRIAPRISPASLLWISLADPTVSHKNSRETQRRRQRERRGNYICIKTD